LITPPSHFTPQKVRVSLVGFTWLQEGETIIKKILLTSWVVKEKIAGENCGSISAPFCCFSFEMFNPCKILRIAEYRK
jgi:hypothetical protein